MAVTIVVGAQWGDEGKGKIVDTLAASAHVVVRFNGGNNAGHTIINPEIGEIALHLIPAGIFNPETHCLIEKGVVVHIPSLIEEMKLLQKQGVCLKKLQISPLAHMVMPWHIAEERGKEGTSKIGTTLRGIGPCYQDKAGRWHALRIADLLKKELFFERLDSLFWAKKKELNMRYGQHFNPPPFREIREEYETMREFIIPYIGDTSRIIEKSLRKNREILLEGAQGMLLDVDYGTYPYVTSSSTTSVAACHITGISPKEVIRTIGVAKAYVTRVGEGPFPTEIKGEEGDKLRELGREYGATTGRPRRCGWLDIPLLRYAARVNHFTEIALTKLDVLGLLPIVLIGTIYRGVKGELRELQLLRLQEYEPQYRNFASWGDLRGCQFRDELPKEAKDYVKAIERYTKIPIKLISRGGARKDVIAL